MDPRNIRITVNFVSLYKAAKKIIPVARKAIRRRNIKEFAELLPKRK